MDLTELRRRIASLQGDESFRAFARRLELNSITLRSLLEEGKPVKRKDGKMRVPKGPMLESICQISENTGVRLDWLVYGLEPKYRDGRTSDEDE